MDEPTYTTTKEELSADVINVRGNGIEHVEAEQVNIHQGGASSISASHVDMHLSGAVTVDADSVSARQSVAMAVRGNAVALEGVTAATVVSEELKSSHSRLGIAVAGQAHLEDSPAVILLAREVHGPVETVLDTQGAMLAGLVAGIAVGMVLFAGNLITRRRS